MPYEWKAGMQVLYGKRKILRIERVTPAGFAVIGEQQFRPDGGERGGGPYRSPGIEPLTDEVRREHQRLLDAEAVARRANEARTFIERFRTPSVWVGANPKDLERWQAIAAILEPAASALKALDGETA